MTYFITVKHRVIGIYSKSLEYQIHSESKIDRQMVYNLPVISGRIFYDNSQLKGEG